MAGNNMRRAFISGASGYLGRHLLNTIPEGWQVLAQVGGNSLPDDLPGSITSIAFDYGEPDWQAVLDFQPNLIIHSGALSSVSTCENDPHLARLVNFSTTSTLAEISVRLGARIIYLSTDQVFDGGEGNYPETHLPIPGHVYGKTKLGGEMAVLTAGTDGLVLRSSLMYGPAINGKDTFTSTMIKNLIAGKAVTLFEDEIRNPVWVRDAAEVVWELAQSTAKGVLNLGGPQKLSRLEMGQIICKYLDLDEKLIRPSTIAQSGITTFRPADCSMNLDKFHSIIGRMLHPISLETLEEFR